MYMPISILKLLKNEEVIIKSKHAAQSDRLT